MKCILLAAGYATRLYPLTENMPKALLDIGKKTMLGHIMDKIEELDAVDDVYIVSNARFYDQFCEFANSYDGTKKISVLNDGTTSNDNRLGAIGDIQFVIDQKNIDDEIFVLASDNLFGFSLVDFYNFYKEKDTNCICAHIINDVKILQSIGVAIVNEDGFVSGFVEKPATPPSNCGISAFYLYKKDTLAHIKEYLAKGNNPDAPGNLIPYLIENSTVYAFRTDAMWFDVGTFEMLEKVREMYK